jgi:hypothetical protein
MDLLPESDLPAGWHYPGAFRRLVDRHLTNFVPWHVLTGEHLKNIFHGLKRRYPSRSLIPFAQRQDCDDVACWDVSHPHQVAIVHDYAAPGWEQRETLSDFYAWVRRAVDDMIEFDSHEPE